MISFLNFLKRGTGWIPLMLALFILPQIIFGQVRFRPRLFLGAGLRRGLETTVPFAEVEDNFDESDTSSSSPKRNSIGVQIRLNLLEVWNFSLGYAFWNHYYEYSGKELGDGLVVERDYPHSYGYTLHVVTLQWNAKYRFVSSKHFVPYIVGGAGRFFGQLKNFRYVDPNYQDDVATRIVFRTDEYEGWAAFFGVGAVFFRYAYFYVGFVDLMQDTLPTRRFLDLTVGITI